MILRWTGTIQDLVVAMLCGLDSPVMSVQNAASWGYFNTQTATWNTELLRGAGQSASPVHQSSPSVQSASSVRQSTRVQSLSRPVHTSAVVESASPHECSH